MIETELGPIGGRIDQNQVEKLKKRAHEEGVFGTFFWRLG